MRGLGLLLFLGSARAASDLIRSAKDPQVPSPYPIGTKDEPFAKPAGTLFEINGKVQYFAGPYHPSHFQMLASLF